MSRWKKRAERNACVEEEPHSSVGSIMGAGSPATSDSPAVLSTERPEPGTEADSPCVNDSALELLADVALESSAQLSYADLVNKATEIFLLG